MLRSILLALALTLAVGVVSPPAANADDGDFGPWNWYYASAYGRLPYRIGNLRTPPYFALNPPVYYGGLVRRPYGDSPFAWDSQRPKPKMMVVTSRAAATPRLIENPYYAAPAPAPTSSDTTSTALIDNPFVE